MWYLIVSIPDLCTLTYFYIFIFIDNDGIIDLDCADLSDEQNQKHIHFKGRNRKMFTKDVSKIGETHLHTGQAISVDQHTPIWADSRNED